jgi:hypothetical protein
MSLARRRLLVATLALAAACAGPIAPASADRPFAPRYQSHARANLASAANTLMTCPAAAAGCGTVQAGAGGSRQNNAWVMGYVDADADTSTFNSSSATLSLPAGATVTFAGLYCGADTSAGTGGVAAPAPAFASSALLDTPGPSGYQAVTGSQHDVPSTWPDRYQEFADVTAEVAAAGAGDYTVANVQAGTGNDRFGGWALVVAYRAPGEPIRNVAVYDGLVTVENTSSSTITVGGFEIPASGAPSTDLGLVSYEGDYGITGDGAALNGTALTDAVNPANNFFNSSIAAGASHVTAKSPSYVEQLGFDSDVVAADGLIPAGATSADLQLHTSGDTYFAGVLTLVTDQVPEAPSSDAPPAVSGTAEDGQTLTATPGAWSGTDPMTHSYQWQRCDAAGANCADVAGATGSTYELGDDDAGHTVRVVVTATNEEGSQTAASAPSGVVAAVAPTPSGTPPLSGTPQAGETLSAGEGTWSGTGPFTYEYQWQRCDAAGGNCVDIPGATGPSYEVTPDDVGSTLVVVVTATNPEGSASQTSPPSAPAAPAPAQSPGGGPDNGRDDPVSLPGGLLAPANCQQVTGSQVLAFKVPGSIRFRIRVAPNGPITAAQPLLARSPVKPFDEWKLDRYVRRVDYRLGGRRIALRKLAPYAVRIGPALLRRATRQTLTVRVVPKRGKPRVARVELNSKPCSEVFTVVHRPSPARSLLGLRVDSVSALRGVVFRVPRRLLTARGSRGAAGKLRVRIAGKRALNYRLRFPRTNGRAAPLLAGAGRPRVEVSGNDVTVSGLPAATAGIRLRLRARGMLATPRVSLSALVQSEAASRRLTQRLGRR